MQVDTLEQAIRSAQAGAETGAGQSGYEYTSILMGILFVGTREERNRQRC